jgi:hypothetical protein
MPNATNDANREGSMTARNQAKEFLTDLLASGPVLRTKIEQAADAHGISNRTLIRAKNELGVVVRKEHVAHGKWVWRLPHA